MNRVWTFVLLFSGLGILAMTVGCGDPNPFVEALSSPVHQPGYFWFVRHAPDFWNNQGSCAQTNCHGPDYAGGASQAPPCDECHKFPHVDLDDWILSRHQAFVDAHTDKGCQTEEVCHSNPDFRGHTAPFGCTTYCHQ